MALIIEQIDVGNELPVREHKPSNVSLFLYNAAVWNAHRIHYDETYTTDVENHPGIVIDGPLQGDWLSQTVLNWLGDSGRMTNFSYSNRRAAYLGETLVSGGRITAIDTSTRKLDLTLFIKNKTGDVITPGAATVILDG